MNVPGQAIDVEWDERLSGLPHFVELKNHIGTPSGPRPQAAASPATPA